MTSIVDLILPLIGNDPPIINSTLITSDYTVLATDKRVVITASSNIVITLPTITAAFKNQGSILFVRKDTTAFTVTFVGTSGNYLDEGFQLGADPQLESIKIYADDDGTWTRDGYGLPEQQEYFKSLSTGLIKIGTDSDDPANLITFNNNKAAVGTRISATEVNFNIVNHAQFDTAIGKYIKSTGYLPAPYNITGVIKSIFDVDNIRVTSLSDPITDNTTTGVLDFGSFNINFGGEFRIVDRINTTNNRYYTFESQLKTWIATNNIDHIVAGADGNFVIVIDDLGVISFVKLVSGIGFLAANNQNAPSDPNYNTDLQIVAVSKNGGDIESFRIVQTINGNANNRIRSIIDFLPGIPSPSNPLIITPVGGNLELTYSGGTILTRDVGIPETSGLNPDQLTFAAGANPTLIIVGTRDNVFQTFLFDVNVDDYESSPGIITAKPNNNASNNFMLGGNGVIGQLLGQQIFGGGSAVADAVASNESIDSPAITQDLPPLEQISVLESETNLIAATVTFTKLNSFQS